ncbi:MAG: sigma-54-dependent Fis family transcriptional regulator [Sterolibacteriaceae bacterium]|uniref:Sigma-54-dependent Fis family transcriptional regulator n=1 Tax=Candidatus Methylophosphatis roskildensis TaxID=2899263 RepID=A0A9D7HNG2_9PROT|nr:sigma-54-dependent Fis family transcriptional regulator [Candidatus Methylophosphatis roskildensis]
MNEYPSRNPRLLIVDDDPLITETLGFVLGDAFDIVTAHTRQEGVETLRRLPAPPELALVDLGLPPAEHRPDEGFALIGELLAHDARMRIIVLSGQNDESNARHARALGAIDFVPKPALPQVLRAALARALQLRNAESVADADRPPGGLIGQSVAMQKLRTQIEQFAESRFPVLIEGESGSGKDVVASCCLHQQTSRRGRPLLALNCAAISPSLVEPTLFGYARGAFTGAVAAKAGYFEDAQDGTLFLDEIGELPLDLQPKLLRVLENGEYQRVGETQTRVSRARIIAATNRDLRAEVRAGRFRADLYHRLSVFTISVPPLRDMEQDRLRLLDHFRDQLARQSGQAPFVLDAAARARLADYRFPGNVRELRNIAIRLSAKFAGKVVGLKDLEAELDLPAAAELAREAEDIDAAALRHLQGQANFSLDETLRRWEGSYIEAALGLTHGNVSQAARLLGINRTTLYNRMELLSRDRSFDRTPGPAAAN